MWDFALELRELRAVGLGNSEMRWLLRKGYIEHGKETTLPGESRRTFRRTAGSTFGKRSCFILTDAGRDAARAFGTRELLEQPAASTRIARIGKPTTLRRDLAAPVAPTLLIVPCWDGDRQELRCGDLVVKQFKVPAPNQETILAAFQEEHWPVRIDDPLPPHPEHGPKRRLHDTIVSLNRNHKSRLLRFTGDGSGQGIRWTLAAADERCSES